MIYTLTLNPSLDLTIEVDELKAGKILKSRALRRDAGGKGLNVTRALRLLGDRSIALGFSGGANGMVIKRLLCEDGLISELVEVDGDVRANLSLVVTKPRRHYKLNEVGPQISRLAQNRLLTLIKNRLARGDYLIVSGSLPPGIPADYIKRIVRLAKKRKARVLLDAAGEALRQGVEAGPYLLKPNRAELLELTGWHRYDSRRAARELKKYLRNGTQHVVVSLGGSGAFYCGRERMLVARPPKVAVKSEVGCGDALLAGLLWSFKAGRGAGEALRWGVAAGTAKVMCPGTQMPSLADVQKVYRRVKVEAVG